MRPRRPRSGPLTSPRCPRAPRHRTDLRTSPLNTIQPLIDPRTNPRKLNTIQPLIDPCTNPRSDPRSDPHSDPRSDSPTNQRTGPPRSESTAPTHDMRSFFQGAGRSQDTTHVPALREHAYRGKVKPLDTCLSSEIPHRESEMNLIPRPDPRLPSFLRRCRGNCRRLPASFFPGVLLLSTPGFFSPMSWSWQCSKIKPL